MEVQHYRFSHKNVLSLRRIKLIMHGSNVVLMSDGALLKQDLNMPELNSRLADLE